MQWVPGDLSLGAKWPGREAGHCPPSSAEVKECVELYLHSAIEPSWSGSRFKKEHLVRETVNTDTQAYI